MTTATTTAAEILVDQVRTIADELGAWPSQRRIMRTCNVGAPKADAALETLRAAGYEPAGAPASSRVPSAPAPAPEVHLASAPETHLDAPETHAPSALEVRPEVHPERIQVQSPDAPQDVTARVRPDADPQVTAAPGAPGRRVPRWPLLVIAAGAFVSIWSGWVGLGKLTGFGPVVLLPGIADAWVINSAITLPLGVEAYAAYAMWVWMSDAPTSARARAFARWSALGALALGAAGQVAYHLMVAAGLTAAPWPITAFVSCLPVVVLGCGGALVHLTHAQEIAS